MEKLFLEPKEIYEVTVEKGVTKANAKWSYLVPLGFLGGAFIAVGFLGFVRIAGSFPAGWEGLGSLLGACLFPLGLIAILIGGGELVTGNMMVVTTAFMARRISLGKLVKNLVVLTIINLVGACFVAYFLGHVTGLTEGAVMAKTIAVAKAKVDVTFWQGFFSAVGCNWLVGIAVWMSFGAKDLGSKAFLIWFPIMAFVIIGFQHLVANMFIIPAAMFAGADITVAEFLKNMAIVFLGNFVGAATLVGGLYTWAYREK